MAPKEKTHATKSLTNDASPDDDCVNNFFGFIKNYCSQGGYQVLRGLFAERDDLRNELEKKTKEVHEIKVELADKTMEGRFTKKDLNKLKEENTLQVEVNKKLRENLAKAEKQRDEIEEQFTKLNCIKNDHDRIEKQLQQSLITNKNLEHELKKKDELAEQLKELKSYSSEMTPWKALKPDNLVDLTEIFTRGLQWAKDFLLQDLNEKTRSQKNWDEIKKKPFLKEFSKSLPASNSPSAKQVRYALGLMGLGKALKYHIFQPLYLSVDPAETERFLSILSKKKTAQQEHARSVLRKVFDAEQTQVGNMRAENAAQDVMDFLSDLVPAEKHEACFSELLNIFNHALAGWKPVFDLKELVTVTLKHDKDNAMKWQILPFPSQENNKNEATAKGGAKNGTSQRKPGQSRTVENLDNGDMDIYEVWPLVYVKDKVLHQGLCVTGDPFNAARDELFEEIKREESRQREARRRQRHSNDVVADSPDSTRRHSSAFLSLDGGTSTKSG